MKNLYLVSYRVRTYRYMESGPETSELKIRAVWAKSEQQAREILTHDIESASSEYSISYYAEIEDVEIALGSPEDDAP